MRVYLSQANYTFGRNAFLPYSAGRLAAAMLADQRLKGQVELGGLHWRREDPAEFAASLRAPDVIGFSCYIWNWEWTLAAARAVRERHPRCVLVAGGPQVPDRPSDPLPFDVLAHGEGEWLWCDILDALLSSRSEPPGSGPVHSLAGTTTWRAGGGWASGPPRPRRRTLDSLPSPYLTGLMDSLLTPDYDFHALQETNRGCPYSCTFCDWGSATMSKVVAVPNQIVLRELDWMAQHRIELVYNCDANFGILPQDEEYVHHMVSLRRETGYPQKFRAAYAKRGTDRVFRISSALAQSGMSKGTTVSLQSLDPTVLDNVARRNIAVEDLPGTFARFAAADIPTYTELILGLPGETPETFRAGLYGLLDAGQHEGINVYPAIALPNSELNRPEYRERHGIITRRVPMMLLHGSPTEPPRETYDLVVATGSMSEDDLIRCWAEAATVQALHCLGPFQEVARALRETGVEYQRVYTNLVNEVRTLARLYAATLSLLRDVLRRGADWPLVIPEFGDVMWPLEEWVLLRLVLDGDRSEFLADSAAAVRRMGGDGLGAFAALLRWFQNVPGEGLADWARDTIWYGRKGGDRRNDERDVA